jgi:hypothetical protein
MKIGGILIVSMLAISSTGFGQLKVHSNGTVSLGTLTSSGYTCTIAGYSALKLVDGSAYLRLSPAAANCVIGTPSDKVAFWESTTGHHQIDASTFYVTSDSSLKTNIVEIDNGLIKVLELNPVTFYYRSDLDPTSDNQRMQYGFLAQEVQRVLPDIVDSSMGVLVMNYDAIIPLLVESVQTQQTAIDSLLNRIVELEESVYDGGVEPSTAEVSTNEHGELIELGQNNPNPFKESTSIPYNIPATTKSAQIIVYDMRGEQLKAYPISNFGEGQLTIEGSTFKAGMYMYALIVDGQYIDSKRMILSK